MYFKVVLTTLITVCIPFCLLIKWPTRSTLNLDLRWGIGYGTT